MSLTRILQSWLFLFVTMTTGCPAAAALSLSLAPPTLTLAPGGTGPALGTLVLSIDGIADGAFKSTGFIREVRDLDSDVQGMPKVTFREAEFLQGIKPQRQWVLRFEAQGLAAGLTHARFLKVSINDESWVLPYQLMVPAAAPTTWAMKLPGAPSRAMDYRELKAGLQVTITKSGPGAIGGLMSGATELRDATTQSTLGGWALSPVSPASSTVTTGTSQWVLKVTDEQSIKPGKFEGSINIVSDGNANGEIAAFTLYVTDWPWQVSGALIILASTALGMWFTQFLRFRSNREQMLVPALLVRDGVNRLRSEVLSLNVPPLATPAINARLQALWDALTPSALESNGLPAIPSPWAPAISPAVTEAFRGYVKAQGDWLDALNHLVATGIRPLREERQKLGAPAAQEGQFASSIQAIDVLARPAVPPTATVMDTAVQAALAAYRAPMGAAALRGNVAPAPSLPRLQQHIARTNLLGWAILCLITSAAGIYFLVLQNAGFGTWRDLGTCFLWGVGLPTGTALAGVTVSSVATTFNITR